MHTVKTQVSKGKHPNMAQYPRPSATNYGSGNLQGFTAEQPSKQTNGKSEIRDGQPLLNARKPGKLNENRFSSLKPSRNDK
jgi:hypothetical protein